MQFNKISRNRIFRMEKKMVYKVVDFFCGAGGFSEGFHQAGFEIIRAYDIWEPALNTHNKNHPSKDKIALYGDVHSLSLLDDEEFEKAVPDSEIIIGSPPCVAFSNSNKSGKADKTLGIILLESYLRIIARKKFKKNSKLKYWVLENVTNIENYVKASYSMEDLGLPGSHILNVKNENSKVYHMQYFGVPSNRKRFICGDFPEPKPILNESEVISLKSVFESLGKPDDKTNGFARDVNYDFKINKELITDHYYIKEIAEFEWEKAKRHKLDKGYMGKMSFPENLDKPARTIMATMSGASRESFILPLAPNRYRYPTIREVATIMSFPIDYRFYGDSDAIKYKLVGNAVPPKFSYALAKEIVKKDGLDNNLSFKPKNFGLDADFVNLNYRYFPLKQEQEKNSNVKYKYHVPYMVINTFRTELLNYFEDNRVKWKTEIHKSQGKRARVYSDFDYKLSFLKTKDLIKLDCFIDEMSRKIISFENFQNNYRQTKKLKEKDNLVGPDELLKYLKLLIEDNFFLFEDYEEVKCLGIKVPQKILIAYYVLSNILTKISSN